MSTGPDPHLSILIEALPTPVFSKDIRGRFLSCNRAFEEFTGKSRTEILGKTAFMVFPRGIAVKCKEMDDALFRNPGRRVSERLVTDVAGDGKNIFFCQAAFLDGKGRPAGLVGAIFDIARREKEEESLREGQERYRTILESIEDGYYEVDLKGNLTFFNDGLCRMSGYSRKELNSMNYREFTDRPNRERIFSTFNAVFRTGQSTRAVDWEIVRKEGARVVIESSVSLTVDDKGNPTGFRGIIRDITGRKEAERALRESREELEKHRNELERLVQSRTMRAEETNRKLVLEIEAREKTERMLLHREQELKEQSRFLEEINTALRVILNQREQDQMEFQGNIVANVRELIFPYMEKLKSDHLSDDQTMYLQVIESNLKNIVSPFISHSNLYQFNFTPSEIRIANLIKQGRATKEIARILGLSERTIEAHRDRIRGKLNLRGRKTNLRTRLLSLD